MTKRIWIMNHYAGDMFFMQGGRHYYFARELKKQGYEPIIFCCNVKHGTDGNYFDQKALWQEHYTDDGVAFVFIRSTPYVGNGKQRIKNMLFFAKNLCTATKQYAKKYGKPDVILASSVHPFTVLAGERIAKKLKVPCICEIRDLWPESIVCYKVAKKNSFIIKAMYHLEKHLYDKSQAIIFTMEGGKDYIIEKGWDKEQGGKIDLNNIYHINNGVDLDLFDYNQEKYAFADPDLDDPSTFKVIYTGSIRLANQVHKLVEVANILKSKEASKVRMLIWGAGDQVEVIKQMIINEGLSNIQYKGSVSKINVPSILARSDLNVYLLADSPLFKYGLSLNKSFEYFASGKPVLASGNAGYSIIDRYRCGVCLKDFTPEAMSDEIIHFMNMPKDEYNGYNKNARQAAQDYDFKNLTNRLLRVINVVTKEKEIN